LRGGKEKGRTKFGEKKVGATKERGPDPALRGGEGNWLKKLSREKKKEN